jgi:hypothetical protein
LLFQYSLVTAGIGILFFSHTRSLILFSWWALTKQLFVALKTVAGDTTLTAFGMAALYLFSQRLIRGGNR